MRIVLCDSHALFAEVLAAALQAHGHEPVAVTTTPADVPGLVRRHRPDACVLDVGLPDERAFDATREICEGRRGPKVLLLASDVDPETVARAVLAGATGFVRKDESLGGVFAALDRMAAGEVAIDPGLLWSALRVAYGAAIRAEEDPLRSLSERERQVLDCIAEALTTEQTARRLGISVNTARTHVQNILVKLGVHTRLEAAALAARARDEERQLPRPRAEQVGVAAGAQPWSATAAR